MSLKKELQQLTKQGLLQIEKDRLARGIKEEKTREKWERDQKNLAATIISKIPTIALEYAMRGEYVAQIMELDVDDHMDYADYIKEHRIEPKGAAKIVYDFCREKELNPKISSYYDSNYGEDGHDVFYLAIDWSENLVAPPVKNI